MKSGSRRFFNPKMACLPSVLFILCFTLTGCGNQLAQVTGVVTLDGEPLRGGDRIHATIYFQPVSGEGATGVGVLDENGTYQLSSGSQQGVAPGEYVVTLSASEIIPSKTPGGTPGGRRISPPKYADARTSGIQFTVLKGANEFDVPLESPSKPAGRRW